jgi:TonB-dependent starch-binding outer membrane protein SusC
MKIIIFISLFFLSLGTINAQRSITGTVSDSSSGEAMIGATVQEKGVSVGTVTDVDGKYSIILRKDTTTLVFSYTGYETQEIKIGKSSVVNVELNYGYGGCKGVSIPTRPNVYGEDLNKGIIYHPYQLIQSRISGLSIAPHGGDPNAAPDMRLRGIATLQNNNQVMVVVDGVPNMWH